MEQLQVMIKTHSQLIDVIIIDRKYSMDCIKVLEKITSGKNIIIIIELYIIAFLKKLRNIVR